MLLIGKSEKTLGLNICIVHELHNDFVLYRQGCFEKPLMPIRDPAPPFGS